MKICKTVKEVMCVLSAPVRCPKGKDPKDWQELVDRTDTAILQLWKAGKLAVYKDGTVKLKTA